MRLFFSLSFALMLASCDAPKKNISPIEKLKSLNDGQVVSNGINADGEYDLEYLALFKARIRVSDIPPVASVNWLSFGEEIKPEVYQHILKNLKPTEYLFISRYPIAIPDLNKFFAWNNGSIEMFEFSPLNDKQFTEILTNAKFPTKIRMVSVVDWTFEPKLVATYLTKHKSVTVFKAFRCNLPKDFDPDKFKKRFPTVTFDFSGSKHRMPDNKALDRSR